MEYIEFPGLGWTIPVSPTLVKFDIGGLPFSINWYGLVIAIGFLLAVLYAVKFAKPRFGIELDPLTDAVLVAALFAVLGARVYYILFDPNGGGISTFWTDPTKVFRIWEGGLAIYGAVIGAFVTGLWMCPLKKINTFAAFDLASIGFLIGQCLGRWGNFFNQEAFGGNTTLPWGMTGSIIQNPTNAEVAKYYDPTLPVHPTFLYESLWCLAGFILLHILAKKAYTFKGKIFCSYIVWYGLGRFWIEGLRTDSLMLGTMRVSQLLAALCVVGGVVLYFVIKARANRAPENLFAEGADILSAEELAEIDAVVDEVNGEQEAQEDVAGDDQQDTEEATEETDNGSED